MGDNLFLSNIKLLRLGIHDNICGPAEVEYIDQVCREIQIDRKCVQPIPDEKVDKIEPTISPPVEEPIVPEKKVKKKIKLINSFSYVESPETILSAIQVSAKIYASQNPTSFTKETISEGLPKEIVQTQRLTQLSAWRRATMKRLNEKIKNSTI